MPPAPVQPLSKPVGRADAIYRDLRGRIQRGEVGPRDRLVDVDLARLYGTSRQPAREALVRLSKEGFLDGSTRGFVLRQPTLGDMRDFFEVRKLLEPRAAGAAAARLSDADIASLADRVEDARRAAASDDAAMLAAANLVFRTLWLEATPNRILADTIERFADHVSAVRRVTLADAGTRAVVVEGLARLAAAFATRDAPTVEAETARFIAAAEAAYDKAMRVHARDNA